MILRIVLCALLMACAGDDGIDTGRTVCEQSCFTSTLGPCRDNCDAECGDDPVCRDTCHGDCIGEYDTCVADNCD